MTKYNIVRGDIIEIPVRIKGDDGDVIKLAYDSFLGDPNIQLKILRFTLFYANREEFAVFGIVFNSDGTTSSDGTNIPIRIKDANRGLITLNLGSTQTSTLQKGFYFGRAWVNTNNSGFNEETSFPDFGLNMGIITD